MSGKKSLFLFFLLISNTLFICSVKSNPAPEPLYKEMISGWLFFEPNETKELLLFDLFEKPFTKNDTKFEFHLHNEYSFNLKLNNTTIRHFSLYAYFYNDTYVLENSYYEFVSNQYETYTAHLFKIEEYTPIISIKNTEVYSSQELLNNTKTVKISYRGYIVEDYTYYGGGYNPVYNWWFDTAFGLATLIILSSLGIVVFFVGLHKLLDFILDKIGEYENKKWELKKLEAQNIIDNND